MINDVLSDAESHMKSAVKALEEHLGAVRTGRANPALVEKLLVEYYGQQTPLYQMATITVPEPMQIAIKPFDKNSIKAIEKAIQNSDLKLTPNSDGIIVRLNLPLLTTERRRELVKVVHQKVEEGKVSVRNIRRSAMEDLKEFEKEKLISEDELAEGEEKVDKLTAKYIEAIEGVGKHKENEVMAI
jgi:ribosome recycling factor